jgi:hypothetical protein
MILRYGASVVAIAVLLVIVSPPTSTAQQSVRFPAGTELHFIVPEETPITVADPQTGENGDMLIVTGKSVGLTTPGNCPSTFADVHLQSATVLDPGDHRTVRVTNEILVTLVPILIISPPPPPIAAGTRLSSITSIRLCDGPGGRVYHQYGAVVE